MATDFDMKDQLYVYFKHSGFHHHGGHNVMIFLVFNYNVLHKGNNITSIQFNFVFDLDFKLILS